MRALLFLFSAVLMAQTPAPKAPPAKTAPAATTAPAVKAAPKVAPKAAPKTAAPAPKAAPTALATDEQKTIYALGLQMHRSLAQFDLSPAELELIKRALTDAAAGKPVCRTKGYVPGHGTGTGTGRLD